MRRRGPLSVLVPVITAGGLIASFLLGVGGAATAGASASASKAGAHVQVGHVTRAAQTHGPYPAPTRLPLAVNQANPPNPGKPGHGKKTPPPPVNNAGIPVVSCAPALAGCDSISTSAGGAATNAHAMAATDNQLLYGQDVEPPDQGLCAGNRYVMEVINIGEMQVFSSSLNPVSSPESLDALMGLTSLGYSSGGDISCLYDPDHGGHWFITEFVSTNSEASGGTFTGCFAGTLDSCREGLAVSSGSNPLTATWSTYFVDPNTINPNDPGAGYLLNDFAKIGNTADAFLLFYDEFNQNPATVPACPAYGCEGFNGSQELAIQKSALEAGSTTVNMVTENMGNDPNIQPPDGSCASGPTAGVTCWYQNIPAQSPSDSDFDNNNGGTGYMVGSLDFVFTGDNRVAVFYWTGLSNLNSSGCSGCSSVAFGDHLFTGVEPYMDEGADCLASGGSVCGLAPQKAGTLDLGSYCKKLVTGVKTPTCPENGIATNGDGTTQASYVDGQLSFAISTLVNETFGSSSEIHAGAAYWIVATGAGSGSPTLTLARQGYVAAAHEDVEFPTLAVGGRDGGLMSFTLSGNGGRTAADNGGFFPSSAYGRVTASSAGLVGSTINVTAVGQGPQDGFSEYQPLPTIPRPRWGDYGAAVFVPGVGFIFASEYIPYPTCSPSYFYKVDRTCGGTRDQNANFGTTLNRAS